MANVDAVIDRYEPAPAGAMLWVVSAEDGSMTGPEPLVAWVIRSWAGREQVWSPVTRVHGIVADVYNCSWLIEYRDGTVYVAGTTVCASARYANMTAAKDYARLVARTRPWLDPPVRH